MSVELTEEQYRQKYLKYKAKYEALKQQSAGRLHPYFSLTGKSGIYHIITSKEIAKQILGKKYSDENFFSEVLDRAGYMFQDGDTVAELIENTANTVRASRTKSKAERKWNADNRDDQVDEVSLNRNEVLMSGTNIIDLAKKIISDNTVNNKLLAKSIRKDDNFNYDAHITVNIPSGFITRWNFIKIGDEFKLLDVEQKPTSPRQKTKSTYSPSRGNKQDRQTSSRGNKQDHQTSSPSRGNKQDHQTSSPSRGNKQADSPKKRKGNDAIGLSGTIMAQNKYLNIPGLESVSSDSQF